MLCSKRVSSSKGPAQEAAPLLRSGGNKAAGRDTIHSQTAGRFLWGETYLLPGEFASKQTSAALLSVLLQCLIGPGEPSAKGGRRGE